MAQAPRRRAGGRTEEEILRTRPYEDLPPAAEVPNMFGRRQAVGARGLRFDPDADEAFKPDLTDPMYNTRNRPRPDLRMKKGGKVMAAKKKGAVHSDEAMDKVLIRKEIEKAKKGARFAKGGGVEIRGKTKGKLT